MMKIVYITMTSLPEKGMASANRILDVARGLVENGHQVSVLMPFSDSGKRETFVLNGVCCQSLSDRPASSFLQLVVKRLLFPLYAIARLLKERGDIVVMYSYSVQFAVVFYLASKLFGMKYIGEVSEYPIYIRRPDRFSWLGMRTLIERTIVPKLYDGMVIMTRPLIAFYQQLVRKNCRCLLLPMTVDCSRFELPAQCDCNYPYIAYCGSMARNKDGERDLVKAFVHIAEKYPDLRLLLIGPISSAEKSEIITSIHDEDICGRVVFVGKIKRGEIPAYICNARILALARPNNKQAEGGFPTKLGEYLSTGVPTVVTRVGDIPSYLTDRKDVYFANPDDFVSVANCFEEILSNYDRAKVIGAAGMETARRCFHYRNVGALLSSFLEQL